MKLTAVLYAWSGLTWAAPNPWGFRGSRPWRRISAYGNRKANTLNARSDTAYSRPPLLFVLPDATQLVDQPFNRPKHRVEERALPLEHPGHEQAHRLREGEDQAEERKNLQNTDTGHGRASELLGLEHRPPEVHEQKHRYDAGYDVVEHDRLLHPLAGLHDAPEREESNRRNGEVKEVEHGRLLCAAQVQR